MFWKRFKGMEWLHDGKILPYVFMRQELKKADRFPLNWFSENVIYKNPLEAGEVDFANCIYHLEGRAFGKANMAMPRWVFYDCAVLPGFVAGFTCKKKDLSEKIQKVLEVEKLDDDFWVPLSLFICIPTMVEGEWVAHNLCSVNTLVDRSDGFYGLGFLTKAFGIWYANVRRCIGITQWGSPAIKLHAHYGEFEVLTAYTPIHTYATTLTYRLRVDYSMWERFFTKKEDATFLSRYDEAGFEIDPASELSMKNFQRRLEEGEGPFFLNSYQVRHTTLNAPLKVYRPHI